MIKSKTLTILFAGILLIVVSCGRGKQNASNNTGQMGNSGQTTEVQNAQNAPENLGKTAEMPKGQSQKSEEKLVIPASTELLVTLDETIQTNVNQDGDQFSGHLTRAVNIDGKTVLPEGTTADMVITKLVKGGRLKTPPEIAFTMTKIITPDGRDYPIASSGYYQKGRSHTKREVGMIGGGAAAGAIIGGIIGKGKGAVIGGAAGAAAGTGAAAATGRQNLVFNAGSTVTFTLKDPLTVNAMQK